MLITLNIPAHHYELIGNANGSVPVRLRPVAVSRIVDIDVVGSLIKCHMEVGLAVAQRQMIFLVVDVDLNFACTVSCIGLYIDVTCQGILIIVHLHSKA